MNASAEESTENIPMVQLVTFKLAEERYGINVMQVQEVLPVGEITPVPGSPAYVLGIINLRGNVVTIFDARNHFGLPGVEVSPASRILIIESDRQIVGMLVDSVAEVVELGEDEITPAPNLGNAESSRYIRGVATLEGELLVVVDLNNLLTDDEWKEVAKV
ncbi:chemotaxis protein CheW [Solemya velesiana gill symbiont]|uniref:Chemotaxis protein CheW n=1 Tax=Solemya velesiana gill symbiont TaxID=1918948 RepID=A0A1T2KWQ3_9GAMM|nr:chemotaxis protein CheW [Solemya velesiana gill symbiont]OOZ37244.1 chemotaxis protein CheW [Solemya velesiana gill symbiont]